MKKWVFILCLMTNSLLMASGGEDVRNLRIQVIDQETGLPIIGADVHVNGQTYYSDPDGFVEFDFSVGQGQNARFSYVSYKDALLQLDGQPAELQVRLASR